MIQIDRAQAIALLEQAVQERGPDYEYNPLDQKVMGNTISTCLYQHQGAPSCGVGLALHIAGVPLETLQTMDKGPEEDTSIGALHEDGTLYDLGIDLTDEAERVFAAFQVRQDRGSSWAYCLAAAKDIM
jgi:hypothetical protein